MITTARPIRPSSAAVCGGGHWRAAPGSVAFDSDAGDPLTVAEPAGRGHE